MGKGSRRRKTLVPKEVADANYEGIFGKYVPPYLRNRTEDTMQVRVTENKEAFGSCGCGRSPTGKCIGWHGLTEEQLVEAQAKYQAENVKDSDQGG